MAKIPFKVSARTARLIGRENIASSKGAIIELVKNSSDADSKVCIVYFDNKYSHLPKKISASEFQSFIDTGVEEVHLNSLYSKEKEEYILKELIDDELRSEVEGKIRLLNHLYILDDGEGMTKRIIENYWMTIGTDNKLNDIFTKSGRIKAGAKGIGRFALDKLGDYCEMTTKYDPLIHQDEFDAKSDSKERDVGYLWQVNWCDFEGEGKTIDNVEAELIGIDVIDLKSEVFTILKNHNPSEVLKEYDFDNGTIIDISLLRDNWDDYFVEQVYSDLEVLVPPEESSNFKIYVFSSLREKKYGLVDGSICDDFDYKIIAEADENQKVKITIIRNEYDVETIDTSFFKREAMQEFPFRLEDFRKGKWTQTKTFSQLIPGFRDLDEEGTFEKIGKFKFTLYFMKRAYASLDKEKFFYRNFMSNDRKDWLDRFGGIKLFRDNFRVRPYGEVNDIAFDWLGLGSRKVSSPAAPSKQEGGYKVEPGNISGSIKISRISNIDFQDKSSREGLQENKTFRIFKKLIEGIISEFEEDRAYIAREMTLYHGEKNREKISQQNAEKLAQEILERKRKVKKESSDETNDQSANEIVLAELVETQKEVIERLEDEQKILRALASSGIVVASFNHELSNLDDALGSRMDELKELLQEQIKPDLFEGVEDFLNPYILIEDIKKQDLKMKNWLKFSIGAARKDKRKRKKINLRYYLDRVEETWYSVFENRGITLSIHSPKSQEIEMRVYEIDLDSIFNNLIVNSIDAFLRNTKSVSRRIMIVLAANDKEINITYNDSGPGLSSDIDEPNDIFKALFTTKRNIHTGEEIGTGLGMWLVETITKDNDGKIKLLNSTGGGFGIRITFPRKFYK